jgi:hypothetical protein
MVLMWSILLLAVVVEEDLHLMQEEVAVLVD